MNTATRLTFGLSLVLWFPLLASAQEPADVQALLAGGLRVPIHTHADDPAFGAYGLWAAGADYKASFHDGFAFYPCLGPDYPENLPLQWRTESIEAGGEVLVTAATKGQPHTTDWRHELHYPGVVEAYDVRADGVEQTFQLREPPVRGGDWTVTGRITTRLVAPSLLAAAHQEIVFTDAQSRPLVRYGKATAIDAAGIRHAVTTSFDGERIRLTVDGTWLATARFPVLLDPLSSAVQVYASGTQGAFDLDLASTNSVSGQSEVMVVFTRASSASDRDAYGVRTTTSFAGGAVVFSDISAVVSSEKTSVAWSSNQQRWAIAFQRNFTLGPAVHEIRVWIHRPDNTGAMVVVPRSTGTTARNPDVGSGGISVALVVYQTDVTTTGANTPNTEIHGCIVDLRAENARPAFLVASQSTRYDRENPSICQARRFSPTWMVVWQELDRNTVNDDWDIWARRVSTSGPDSPATDLTAGMPSSSNKVRPQVAGDRERYMMTCLLASSGEATSGPEIRTVRFDQADGGSSITGIAPGVLRASTTRVYSELTIAHDRNTDSHWAIGYESRTTVSPGVIPTAHLDRVGFTGGIVEATSLVSHALGGFHPAVSDQANASQEAHRFLVVYAAPAGLGGVNIQGRDLNYAAAPATTYGTPCGTGSIHSDVPLAGIEDFTVEMFNAPVLATAVLLLSTGPGSVPLDGSGMTGCVFNVSPTFFLPFVTTTDGSGRTSLAFPLPDRPAFLGDLYFQWIYVSFGANPANLQATRGLRAQVR